MIEPEARQGAWPEWKTMIEVIEMITHLVWSYGRWAKLIIK